MRYFQWTVREFHQLWNPDNCEIIILELDKQSGKYLLKTPLRINQEEGAAP